LHVWGDGEEIGVAAIIGRGGEPTRGSYGALLRSEIFFDYGEDYWSARQGRKAGGLSLRAQMGVDIQARTWRGASSSVIGFYQR
jgi:hypothetical protein